MTKTDEKQNIKKEKNYTPPSSPLVMQTLDSPSPPPLQTHSKVKIVKKNLQKQTPQLKKRAPPSSRKSVTQKLDSTSPSRQQKQVKFIKKDLQKQTDEFLRNCSQSSQMPLLKKQASPSPSPSSSNSVSLSQVQSQLKAADIRSKIAEMEQELIKLTENQQHNNGEIQNEKCNKSEDDVNEEEENGDENMEVSTENQLFGKHFIDEEEFEFQRDLVEHAQQLHPGIKALKCRNCDVTFRNSNSISRHFRIHKTLTKKYICEFCYKPFPFKDYLQSHIKKTHFTIGGNHTCNVCKRTFKHIDGLNQHKKMHLPQEAKDGDTVLNKSENVEQEKFITTTSANEAKQIKEANTLEINSVASEAEEDEDQISKSVTETLNKFKSRHRLLLGKCGFCKMTINNYREFVKHLAEFHPDFKAFKCKKCDHHFPSTGSLKYHNYYCHSEKREKHVCNICSQSFDGVRKLRDHLLTHEDDPFKCKICENVFSNKKSLAAHMYYSHSEKRKRHICHICSKEFNRVSNLKGHMNIHTDERPIRCNVCDKRFKDMRQLKSHQRVHEARKIQYPTQDVDQQHDDSQQFEQITDINEGGETLNLEYGYGHVKPEPNLNEFLNYNS